MAKKVVKHDDLFEAKITAGIIKDMDDLIKKNDEVEKSFKKVADGLKKIDSIKSSKDLKKFTTQTKKLTEAQKQRSENQKVSIEIGKKIEQQGKRLKIANSDRIQQQVQLTRLTKEQNAANKDTEILNNKNAGTLEKIAASSRKLRREREKLNLESTKDKKRLVEINRELDKNNKVILKNSDALKKQKINVGNYSESIKEAASASGLFGKILGPLTAIQGTLTALTKKDTVAKEVNAVATTSLTAKQKAMALTTGSLTKATKLFNLALKRSPIFIAAAAIGGLIAFFTRAQSGVDALSTGFAGLTTAFDVIIDRFSLVGEGIKDIVLGISSLDSDQISAGLDKIGGAFKGIGDELAREVELATQLKQLTIELTREQKLFEAQQASEITKAKELNLISRDKLKSDQVRLQALKDANKIEIALSERQLELQEAALAASLDSISADEKSLELGAEQLEFIQAIKEGRIDAATAVQQAADFTLSSAAGEEALFEIVDKIVAQEQARQSLLDKQATTIKKTSALQVQIATKNAQALVREATAFRQLAKDQEESIERRIELLVSAADKEIESFEIQAEANIKNEQEVAAARLQINAKLQADIKALTLKANKEIKEEEILNEFDIVERIRRIRNARDTSIDARRDELKRIAQLEIDTVAETDNQILEINELLKDDLAALDQEEIDSVNDKNAKILESEKQLQADREALAEARINTAKNVADILGVFAGEDEEAQKRVEKLRRVIAVSEIITNLQTEISKIRENNADKDNKALLNAAQIAQATTFAGAGVAKILAFEKGGLVEGSEKIIRINEKGPEFVLDHSTTKQLGLDKKGSKMQDFHEKFTNNINIPQHLFKNIDPGGLAMSTADYTEITQNQTKTAEMIASTIKKNATDGKVLLDSLGQVVTELRKGDSTERIVYEKDSLLL